MIDRYIISYRIRSYHILSYHIRSYDRPVYSIISYQHHFLLQIWCPTSLNLIFYPIFSLSLTLIFILKFFLFFPRKRIFSLSPSLFLSILSSFPLLSLFQRSSSSFSSRNVLSLK